MSANDTKLPLTKRGIKKMDALVTGMILGGIVASIYGINKKEAIKDEPLPPATPPGSHSLKTILQMLIFGVDAPTLTPPQKNIFQKIHTFFVGK